MSAQSAIFNPTDTTSAATGSGFSVPRLTTTGRLAIVFGTGDQGMMVYDTTLNNLFIWNGTAWVSVPDSGDSSNEQVIFNDNGVLIGDPGLLFNKTTDKLTVATNLSIWRGLLNQGTSTAVGDDTLNITVVGANANTAIGYRAASQLTTGTLNTGVGHLALRGSVGAFTGGSNTAVGASAGLQVSSGGSNSFFGKATGGAVTTGSFNVAVGHDALANTAQASTASNNIAIGNTAMFSASPVTGDDNIGVGRDTLRALSSGADNVAIGRNTANLTTTGSNNVAIGLFAGEKNISGQYTIGIGYQALRNNTASDNVGIGNAALGFNQSGTNNTAVGTTALLSIVSTSNNTALGANAARSTTASSVTAIGSNALALATSGDGNTAIGLSAIGGGITTGGYNTAVGYGPGFSLTSGASNVFIGTDAGAGTTTGASNIAIGRGSGPAAAGNSNEISIGSATYFVGTNAAANTYYATANTGVTLPPAGSNGFWRVLINGTARKLAVYPD